MIQTWRKTSSELIYSPNVIKDIHMKTIDGYDVKIFTDNIEGNHSIFRLDTHVP